MSELDILLIALFGLFALASNVIAYRIRHTKR